MDARRGAGEGGKEVGKVGGRLVEGYGHFGKQREVSRIGKW